MSLSIAADGRRSARLLDDITFRHGGAVDVRSLPWQSEPYKAVSALDEISAMTNCCATRGHYSGSSRMRHRDPGASNVVTLDASIERPCPHPTLSQRTTLSRLRTKRQVGMHDARTPRINVGNGKFAVRCCALSAVGNRRRWHRVKRQTSPYAIVKPSS